jgi:hypothetical protein
MRADLLKYRPQTKEELWYWLKATFNIEIPNQRVCDDHVAPFEVFSNRFFSDSFHDLNIATRSGGKTYLTALEAFLKAIFYPGISIGIVAAAEAQAKWAIKYIMQFQSKIGASLLSNPLYPNHYLFPNGSEIIIMRHSSRSVRGSHLQILYVDEVDEVSPVVFSGAMFISKSNNLHKASISISSTKHKIGGLASSLVENFRERGLRLNMWCILEVMRPCESDCRTCNIKFLCRGRVHKKAGFFNHGYMTTEDVCRIVQLTGSQALSELFLLDLVSQTDLVLPIPQSLIQDFKKEGGCYFAGVDWGVAESPAVIVVLQYDSENDLMKVVKEYEFRNVRESVLAERAKAIAEKWQIQTFYCDPSGQNGAKEFASKGLRVHVKAVPLTNSIHLLRSYIEREKIVFHKDCFATILEFKSWKYKTSLCSLLETSGSHHYIDAIRYAVWGLRKAAFFDYRIEALKTEKIYSAFPNMV